MIYQTYIKSIYQSKNTSSRCFGQTGKHRLTCQAMKHHMDKFKIYILNTHIKEIYEIDMLDGHTKNID